MRTFLLFAFLHLAFFAVAQKQTFDIVKFLPPKGWQKEQQKDLLSFIKTDAKTKTWCRLFIVRSTASKGDIETDFKSEWSVLAAKQYGATETPQLIELPEEDGWKGKGGVGSFKFNNADAIIMLTTLSGYGRCVSLVATTNSETYMSSIEQFFESIDLIKPAAPAKPPANTPQVSPPATPVAGPSGFYFSTTNFDDGWTSVAREDFVEATKGNIKVILHYPKEGTRVPADPDPFITNAWNILVAPRYSNLRNYTGGKYVLEFGRGVITSGTLRENATGKDVFVALFQKSETPFIEIVCPDEAAFVAAFGFRPKDVAWDWSSDTWKPLVNLSGLNKFAVAASDLKGTWTSDFSGVQQMYHVYTGQYAGMNMNQSNTTFDLGPGNAYKWRLLVVRGMVGSAQYINVKSQGKFSVPNNWQISFSDIEGKPKTYNAYFSCIKGGRLLWLSPAEYKSPSWEAFGLTK